MDGWLVDNINQLAYYIKTFKFMSIVIVLSRLNEVKVQKNRIPKIYTNIVPGYLGSCAQPIENNKGQLNA